MSDTAKRREPLRCVIVCDRDVLRDTTTIALHRTDRDPYEPLTINGRPVVIEFSTGIVEDILYSKRFAERILEIEGRLRALEERRVPWVDAQVRSATPLGD